MIASSACAVQIFEVAFSRRICCSRVCSARRYAGLPSASIDWPTSLPGIERLYLSRTAKKPACGPPKPIGTPKRCELPTTTSAPNSAGDLSKVSASKSLAIITNAPLS